MMMIGSGSILHLGATGPRFAREAGGSAYGTESPACPCARSQWHSGLSLVAAWAGWGRQQSVADWKFRN